MEDFCQLTEKPTEHKYRGSYEQIARAILRYSAIPGLDVLNFYEVVLFSFLTGNADMHLKNFSLIEKPGLGMGLAPAYDLVNTALVNPADNEEMALSLNGRRNKIGRTDFEAAFTAAGLTLTQQRNLFSKMAEALPSWRSAIATSFLSPDSREKYWAIVEERAMRLGLV
jgi:serine/threonine-protein kinase HipA